MDQFKTQLVAFLDDLIEQFPMQSEFIVMRIFVKDKIPISTLINQFITDVLPHVNLIKNRDDSFFKNTQLIGYPNKPKFFQNFQMVIFLQY